jgi:hypothetical protein
MTFLQASGDKTTLRSGGFLRSFIKANFIFLIWNNICTKISGLKSIYKEFDNFAFAYRNLGEGKLALGIEAASSPSPKAMERYRGKPDPLKHFSLRSHFGEVG